MPNTKGWYTKEEVLKTGLPYYIPSSKRWTETPYEFAVLLTKTRCKEFGIPVMGNGLIKEDRGEYPSAFRYAAAAGTGESSDQKLYKYIPLYDRTSVWEAGEISMDKLYEHEIMGIPTKTCSVCGGSGFAGITEGTGYSNVCDQCAGKGAELA